MDNEICIDIDISLDEYWEMDMGMEVVLHGGFGLLLRTLISMWTSMLVRME